MLKFDLGYLGHVWYAWILVYLLRCPKICLLLVEDWTSKIKHTPMQTPLVLLCCFFFPYPFCSPRSRSQPGSTVNHIFHPPRACVRNSSSGRGTRKPSFANPAALRDPMGISTQSRWTMLGFPWFRPPKWDGKWMCTWVHRGHHTSSRIMMTLKIWSIPRTIHW